jgi:hypothetical protein
MSEENVIKIVILAVSDPEYRELLFNDPAKALEGIDLTEEESDLLHKMEREHFDDAFSELDERVSRAGLNLSLSTSPGTQDRRTPSSDFGDKLESGLSTTADVALSAGSLAAPYVPGGAVVSAAISGLGQLKNSVGG